MIPYHELTLADKASFDRILSVLQPESSDLTFTNLFMWQYNYNLHSLYLQDLDFWVLLARPTQWKAFYLPPLGDWTDNRKLGAVLQKMRDWAEADGFEFRMRRIPEPLAQALERIDPALALTPEPNTSDYVYRAQDLITLAGRKYHGKRNHLNQFQRKYAWEYQRMTPEIVEECLQSDKEWFNICGALERDGATDEEKAMALVMQNYAALGLTGGVIRINGRIEAVSVGERLTSNMAVILIEKANTEFDGTYTGINQQFAADAWKDFEFINREEDLGLEGLRKAKESYHPEKMVEKFGVKY